MQRTPHLSDEMLNGWIDGAITVDERDRIDHHLNQCELCQSELDGLVLIKGLLRDLPEPALPRSFQLTELQASRPTPIPISSTPSIKADADPDVLNASKSNIVRLLPIVRVLSIAAILAVMVIGGTLAFGSINEPQESNNQLDSQGVETVQEAGESENANPAPKAVAPGEIVDQGQSASSSNSVVNAMVNGIQSESKDTGESDGMSPLAIVTILTSAFAIVMVGSWVLLTRSSRSVPTQ